MTNLDFLARLQREGKLELVSPSEDICQSYLEKSGNCLKSAKILLQNKLYDNSTTMSYYAMYNSLTALLFKIGITPTRRSCPIHGLKPVVFTDTRLDRRVGGMEKCAHPRTEVRGFRRHFFIKCENHSGAILLLKFLFKNNELFTVISKAKEERIDKQYYVQSKQMAALTENSTKELFISAESFSIDIKSVINNLTNDEIKQLRDVLSKLTLTCP